MDLMKVVAKYRCSQLYMVSRPLLKEPSWSICFNF